MKITSQQDVLKLNDQIVKILKDNGEFIYSRKLANAIVDRNEIPLFVGQLRLELLLLLRDRHTVDKLGIEKQLNDLVDYLNSILDV